MSATVGLLFGTFNPIHKGHVALGQYFIAHTKIDQILYIISPQSPFKSEETLLDNHIRLEMVAAALANEKQLEASTIEFDLPQPNYTFDTLELLRKQHPQHEFILLMGADNIARFQEWKNYTAILEQHAIYVYPRGDFDTAALFKHPKVQFMAAPKMEVSSTQIKRFRDSPLQLAQWLHPNVIQLITKKGLYR